MFCATYILDRISLVVIKYNFFYSVAIIFSVALKLKDTSQPTYPWDGLNDALLELQNIYCDKISYITYFSAFQTEL